MAVKKRMYTGDLKPDYRADLADMLPDGETPDPAFDLTLATEVRVIGKILLPDTDQAVPLFNRLGQIAGNTVVMAWEPEDTARVGLISTEVEVLWPGNKPQTFRPAELVQVLQDFGGGATSGPGGPPPASGDVAASLNVGSGPPGADTPHDRPYLDETTGDIYEWSA